MKFHLIKSHEYKTFCGKNPDQTNTVRRYDEDSLHMGCKTCARLSCEDCMGTGVRSRDGTPTTVGICCGCDFDV